jgi:hypothetical protein
LMAEWWLRDVQFFRRTSKVQFGSNSNKIP